MLHPALGRAADADATNGSEAAWQPLIVRLTALAASEDEPGAILRAVATEVLRACDASAVAVYSVAATSQSVARAQRLEQAAMERATGAPPLVTPRRLQAAAHSALARRGLWEHILSHRSGADAAPAVLLALPLGESTAHTVLVVCVRAEQVKHASDVLIGTADALGAVARTASLALQLERAGRRHTQLQAIFSHSSEAILTVDRGFHIVEANPAFTTLLEWEPADSLGKHCSTVLMCRDERGRLLCHTESCPLAQAFVLAHSAPYREVIWQTAGGKSKEVSASFAPVPSPGGPRGVIIARDMTLVNAANRMRSNFISMVSHELRTPLNSINGFLEIVLEGHVGSLTPRQDEFLNYARGSTHQLMTLVEDILFISRADTGQFKLRFNTVALPELFGQVLQNYRPAAARAQVDLRVAAPPDHPTVYADELRLQQVLGNLISNAIKFTPPQGVVSVCAAVSGDMLRFDVCDTGAGVPIEERVRIFERFYQSESPTQASAGGYGLGLAIAKLIVEQHGGRIWVDERPEGGSIFSFTIPLRPRVVPTLEPPA